MADKGGRPCGIGNVRILYQMCKMHIYKNVTTGKRDGAGQSRLVQSADAAGAAIALRSAARCHA
ncbi:MAG: hypothetical protein KBH33_12945, partial [Alicycliphilus sp.]|nr:hypothetical protein [Alicycliphilus sp.]